MAPIEEHLQTVQVFTESNSADSVHADESRIIEVMSSNVDDLLYGYLPKKKSHELCDAIILR